ncbi:MAG: tRNA (adenosine(37)-N6)-threonylcarbamoyltransferase complex ATPase subunit type 1 TsaE [Henriciella sp.]|nr:tRNA (adenosine(37)-N6)-threonylcarbamoyltransferase complex ATPase subunit type 1 TsaE [Henriciella sp.]
MDTMIPPIALTTLARTSALAQRLAPVLKAGDVIALHGNLGAGKTTFARALINALMTRTTEVPSPTYTLLQTYDAPSFPIYHFDLYRLNTPDEVLELDWYGAADGLARIEWPDRAGDYLPKWRLDLTLDMFTKTRTATLEPRGEDWQTRLHGF